MTPAVIAEVEKKPAVPAEVIKKKERRVRRQRSIADVIHDIALDRRRIQPVSSLQNGAYGVHDVCLSVPTIVGRGGALQHLEVDLWPKELAALQKSAHVLRETIDKVLAK